MKIVRIILIMFFSVSLSFATDNLNEQINIKLQEIRTSDSSIRYQKMNELKILLRKVNSENRIKIINNMRKEQVKPSSNIGHNNMPKTDIKREAPPALRNDFKSHMPRKER